ncbi:Flagellar motor switch protein FliG C-terminal domain-containing protein [Entamoeba marina]
MLTPSILAKLDISTLRILAERITKDSVESMKKNDLTQLILSHCKQQGIYYGLDDLTVSALHDVYELIKTEEKEIKTRASLIKHIHSYMEENDDLIEKLPNNIKAGIYQNLSGKKSKKVTNKEVIEEATSTGFANLLNKVDVNTLNEIVGKFAQSGSYSKKEIIAFLIDDEEL